jgi:hypothetical protein
LATARPFAYNTGSLIPGTEQVGDLAIGVDSQAYNEGVGGVRWWNGPDEDLGYVIAQPVPAGDQPNPDFVDAYVGFFRTNGFTEVGFIQLAERISNYTQTFLSGAQAKIWLNQNGYWTSYLGSVTSGLVLYYDPSNELSYPGTGVLLNDLSGNNLTGTLSSATFTDPYFSYNGSSSKVSVPDNALLEPGSGNWTTEAWFYPNSFSSSSVVLGKFDNGGLAQNVSYSIRINTSGALFAQYSNGSFSTFVNSTSYTLTTNTWYQVVYVWTNSGGVKTLQTFINGSSIGTVNHTFASILNSTNPLYLGSYNGGEYNQWFSGRIGITRIYNNALSSIEVLQNFDADKSKYGL